jgi:hypothetical protein
MTVAQRRCAPTCENADGIEMKGGKLGRQGALKLDWPPCQPHWSHPQSLCSPHPPAECTLSVAADERRRCRGSRSVAGCLLNELIQCSEVGGMSA